MDLKRLSHIVGVADQRNFARAAEQLHLSQPALTRSVQAAEAEFGMRLFDRGTTEVTPTPAGDLVLERARRLLFDSRCLKRDVDLFRDRALGDTAFGIGPVPAATFLARMLVDLRQSYPAVKLRVELGNWAALTERLRAEDIEFFVADTRDLPSDPRLQVRALRRAVAGFYVRAGHPLAQGVAVTMAAILACGVATVRLPGAVRDALSRLAGLPPATALPLAVECDDLVTLKQVAAATDTVLGSIQAAVAAEVVAGTLVPLEVQGLPLLYAEMGVVSLRGRTPSPMADLIMRRLPGAAAGGDGLAVAP